MIFKIWKYALGSYSDDKTEPYDNYITAVRSIIFVSYLVTNCFIISGVIRHWNSATPDQCQDRSQMPTRSTRTGFSPVLEKGRLSKSLLLVLELNDAMEHLGWDLSKVEYEVVTHHDVPDKDDGYIVIRKTNPDTWYVNNKDVKND